MRCADVAVEEKEEDVVVAVEVERAVAGGARGTTTGQLPFLSRWRALASGNFTTVPNWVPFR